MNNSFIVTGASASGKTTLIEYARKNGYNFLPTHTSRTIRSTETNGIDIISISEQEFINNFNNGDYLEPSLDSCMLKGVSIYYGTPKDWIKKLEEGNFCASPSSPITARIIEKETNVIWIHLYCNDKDRYLRLKQRGIGEEEIKSRMNFGDSINIPDDATISINTSNHRVEEILKIIQNLDKNKNLQDDLYR